uniref:Uncharacterized protein n=1 Tax=Anguilla anguilla TaxID=7936 RepID=A0A0E9VJ10_ANGAN
MKGLDFHNILYLEKANSSYHISLLTVSQYHKLTGHLTGSDSGI